MAKDDDILEEAKECFAECEERESDDRDAALSDLKFARLSEQWDPVDEEKRRKEGRHCLTINKLPAFIRQVVNDARQNTPAISVRAVDSKADPKTAEIIGGLARDIEAQSDADTAYDTAVDAAVSSGFGFFRINTEYAEDDGFEQDIRIRRIENQFSVYGDPDSFAADSSDWNVAFVINQMKRKKFERQYKGADFVGWDDARWSNESQPWKEGESIGVAEYWTREQATKAIIALSNGEIVAVKDYEKNKAIFDAQGITVIGSPRNVKSHKVTQRIITGCDVLETVDWAGKYIPIVPVYGEDINVAGKRYLRSLIRDAKDAQRMFNYSRTLAAELGALAPKAPFIGRKGAFKSDAAKWATANRATHAFIEYDGDIEPKRQPFAGVPTGAMAEALSASDDMKAILGMYDASLGQRSNETSGKAINARKAEGDTGSFHFVDNLSRAIRHGGRIVVDLIPKVYSTARIIRTLGEDKKTERLVTINQPHTEQGIERIYDLTVGKYDVAVKAGPSFSTRREEASSQMMELIRVYPDAAPIIGDLLADNLDWPGADQIAKRLKAMLPPQLQNLGEDGQPQAQTGPDGQPIQGAPGAEQPPAVDPAVVEQGMQIIQQLKEENSQLSGDLQKAARDSFNKSMDLKIKAYEAETHRIAALKAIEVERAAAELDAVQNAPAAQGGQDQTVPV